MAFELTTTARLLSQQTNIKQQLILEIDGIDLIFGSLEITKLWRIGNDARIGDPGLVIGGVIGDENGRDYISLSGTTNNIKQQIEIETGGVGSVQKININLIDKDQELTREFQPGNKVSDLLGREANVFLNFGGSAHPDDSIRLFNGIITSQQATPGSWKIGIDHPEFLKRSDIFQQTTTNLDGAITAGSTSIVVNDASQFLPPVDILQSFLLIDDELIEVGAASGNTFPVIQRGAENTIAASHDDDVEVTSYYKLNGPALDMALKVMLSGNDNGPFKENEVVTRFEQVSASEFVENGIYFSNERLQDELGLTVGDLITITGATEASNNVTDAVIGDFQVISSGLVIVLLGVDLVAEIDSTAVASFKSQYAVLPNGAGCGMKPSQVDVAEHINLNEFFAIGLPDLSLKIDDGVTAKDLITNEIYFPLGFYQVPRKGRASVSIIQPPLVLEELAEFTEENVIRPDANTMTRQITQNFFNNVQYRFGVDSITDKFTAGEVVFSQRSINRIPTINKSLKIDSKGLTNDPATRAFVRNQAKKFSDFWQFAPEAIRVETDYRTGFKVEIADTVLFGSNSLQIPDINSGTRDFEPRLMTVIDKQLDVKQGKVRLSLLDSSFGLDGRFGVISPSSFIGANPTTTSVALKPSFTTGQFDVERDKWINLIGEQITIHSLDYTYEETSTLIQFDPANSDRVILDPPLSSAPLEDYVMDLAEYNLTPETNPRSKGIHVFFGYVIGITAGIDNFTFEVAPADIGFFAEEQFVRVYNSDFSLNSRQDSSDDDAQIASVDTVLNRITLDRDIGFTPAAGFFVDTIGFQDGGLAYRLV